jgi:hypothetical protein
MCGPFNGPPFGQAKESFERLTLPRVRDECCLSRSLFAQALEVIQKRCELADGESRHEP